MQLEIQRLWEPPIVEEEFVKYACLSLPFIGIPLDLLHEMCKIAHVYMCTIVLAYIYVKIVSVCFLIATLLFYFAIRLANTARDSFP